MPIPTATDPAEDDPTIRIWRGYADRLHVRRLLVVNLFAMVATDPADLRRAAKARWIGAVGELNDAFTAAALSSADQTIVAWGAHASGQLAARVPVVVELANRHARGELRCLGTTTSGAPVHPLRKSTNRVPVAWTPPQRIGVVPFPPPVIGERR